MTPCWRLVGGLALSVCWLPGCGSADTGSSPDSTGTGPPPSDVPVATAPLTTAPLTTAPLTTEGTPGASTTEWATVAAPALAGNLLDDPAELRVAVWLPPSYQTTDDDYPVVYFLAGFGEDAGVASIGTALERAISTGDAPEVIVVGVSGRNSLGGSFYVDSPVTGDWARAVHDDLVTWVDDHYRTVATRDARVVAGFSMGGFGAFDLAMRHADVFGSVYALSPGALAPGALAEMEMFADEGAVESYLAMQEAVADGGPPTSLTEGARFALAYGSAFAPDVEGDPPWVEYPFARADDAPDPTVWARWESGFGGIEDEVVEHRDALASLHGIALDVGTGDPYEWIPDGTQHLADTLTAAGIEVQFTTYPGGHGPVNVRAAETLVPFLADVLAAE